MSSGSKRMKWPTLTKGTRLSATRRRICRGEVASHSARTSISTSRRCAGGAGGPGRLVSVLAWLLPPGFGGPVSNGDIDADVIAHRLMAVDPSTEASHVNIASWFQAQDSDAPVRPTGSAHRSPIDAEPRAPSAADEPRSGLVDLWALRSVPRTVRTTRRSCERRTNHTDPFGSRFWTDDLPGYGPTVGWQIQLRSRRVHLQCSCLAERRPALD